MVVFYKDTDTQYSFVEVPGALCCSAGLPALGPTVYPGLAGWGCTPPAVGPQSGGRRPVATSRAPAAGPPLQ